MASLAEFLEEWRSDSDYVDAHTSGSTGAPKHIHLLKADMIASAEATNAFFNINESSVLACPLSFGYIAGKMMAVRSEVAKCKLLEMPVSNNVEIGCETIDLLSIVPSQAESLLRQSAAPAQVKNLLLGGAPVTDKLRHRIIAAGFNAWIGYGMTETCSHVALRNLNDDSEHYHAMLGITFNTDNRGCLEIISDRFSWGKLVTNDIVELIDSTTFRWIGRADNAITSGGVKVHPEEVEKIISRNITGMPPFYVIGEDNDKWGQQTVLVAECSEHEARNLYEQLRTLDLQPAQRPKAVLIVGKLPCTKNGNKILRVIPEGFIRIC
jgi:O-succinylbenzoic acid--CoA ligase